MTSMMRKTGMMKSKLEEMKKEFNDHCDTAIKATNEADTALVETVTLDDIADMYHMMFDIMNRR